MTLTPEQAKNQMMYLVSSMKSQIHKHTNNPLPDLYDHDIPMNRNNVDTTCNQFGKLFLDHILDRFKFLHISDPDMQLSDHYLQSFGIRCEYTEYLEDKQEL